MRIARGQREILGQDVFHRIDRLRPRALDRAAVVFRRGQHVRAGEEEHCRKAEERKVHAEIAAAAPGDDAIDERCRARQHDGQRHPAVGGIGALIDALGLGRERERLGHFGVGGEEGLRLLERFAGRERLR